MKKSIIAAVVMAALSFSVNVSAQSDCQKKCDAKTQCDKTKKDCKKQCDKAKKECADAKKKCDKGGSCCKAKKADGVTAATQQTAKKSCCKADKNTTCKKQCDKKK